MTGFADIRRLARGGAADRAWQYFVEAGFDAASGDHKALTLKGRLLKDLAMRASGDARIAYLRRAAEAYAAASALTEDSYPRINAATLVYLRGDRASAAALASDLLALLDGGRHGAETAYWLAATRAEALLLLGRVDDARSALAQAVAVAPNAREDRAATLRQFRRILSYVDQDESWLDAFALPAVMHFRGPMSLVGSASEQAIADRVASIAPGMAYGALAAGTDLVAAEAALAVGAELHVVLPSSLESFRAISVAPLGDGWGERFDAVVDQAISLETLDEPGGLTEAAVRMADDMAMGLAVHEAIAADSQPVMLRARWVGADDTPLLQAPHRLETVELDTRADASAPALPMPLLPRCEIAGHDDRDHRIIPLTDLALLASSMKAGDIADVYVAASDDVDPPRFASLLAVGASDRILLSRPAALVAVAQCPDCRPFLTGSIDGAAGPIEIYEIGSD
jgi:hypothetical protein